MSQESSDLAAALLKGLSEMAPIFDAADGMRADLERRGWSPTAAEVVALEWLQGCIKMTWAAST